MSLEDKIESTSIRTAVARLVHELQNIKCKQECLKISMSSMPSAFDDVSTPIESSREFYGEKKVVDIAKFDLVIGHFWKDGFQPDDEDKYVNKDEFVAKKLDKYFLNKDELKKEKSNITNSWSELLEPLKFLKNDGFALFAVSDNTLKNDIHGAEQILNSNGFYISALFDLDELYFICDDFFDFIEQWPFLVLITKQAKQTFFLADLDSKSDIKDIVENYFTNNDTGDLEKGMFHSKHSFVSFSYLKEEHRKLKRKQNAREHIKSLVNENDEYKLFAFKDIAIEINTVAEGKKHKIKDNSILLPKMSEAPIFSCSSGINEDVDYKFFQVVLNERGIDKYVSLFLNSRIGSFAFEVVREEWSNSILFEKHIKQMYIPLPSIDIQKKIVATHQKLNDLKKEIDQFEEESLSNLTSVNTILPQLDSMLDVIGKITKADQIINMVSEGESKTLEFKETLSLDIKKRTKEKYIELAVLKTIVAFLNSKGGVLLIGISDDGEVQGVNKEIEQLYKGSSDRYLLHLKNKIKEKIGEENYTFIETNIVEINNDNVVEIRCKQAKNPCFYGRVDFYVRTNPATDKLVGENLIKYVENHFEAK